MTSLTDQTIIAPRGQYRRVVRNIEHTGGSTYGETVINGVTWVVRRERGRIWRAIGRKADLDQAEQGIEREPITQHQRRIAMWPWSMCIRSAVV